MPLLLLRMPRRALLLRRLRLARDRHIARTHEAAERQGAMRRLLDQVAAETVES